MRCGVWAGAAVAMACGGAGGAGTVPEAPAAPGAPAAHAPAAASSAPGAAAKPAQGPTGTCTALAESEALNEAEQERRLVHLAIAAGRVVEANDYSGTQAMGGTLGKLSGAGPALEGDSWIEVPMAARPVSGPNAEPDPSQPASMRKLRIRVSGTTLTVEGGPTGRCEWSAPAPAIAKAAAGEDAPEPKLEHPEPGHVIVRAGAALLDCTATHAAQAALTQCRLQGPAGGATLAWGMSDDGDRILCSRTPQQYSWQHGGGWEAGGEHFRKLGADGARVVLGPGVEVWIAPRLAKLALSSGARSVELEVALEDSKIEARSGAAASRAGVKLLLDLGDAKKSPASCSGD